jgi:ribonuclease HII
MQPDWGWELGAWGAGRRHVAGVDEAGRGPLAGPVVAAAVILPRGFPADGIHDSKQLPAERREDLCVRITSLAVCWSVGSASPEEIDEVNILRATHRAMARALAALDPAADWALVDGLPVQGLPCPHQSVVAGDARSISIAAASIVAKVTRDRMMRALDAEFPGYGFAQHKGYTTPEHRRALKRLGPCACHRKSFSPVGVLLAPGETPESDR